MQVYASFTSQKEQLTQCTVGIRNEFVKYRP